MSGSELPKGWVATTSGELSEYITSGSRDWKVYYSDKGAVFIRTQDINKDRLDLSDAAYVSLPERVEGKRSLVRPGDLLITITGANVGKVAVVPADVPESYVSQSVGLVRLRDARLAYYLHLFLQAESAGRGHVNSMVYGLGRPVLSLENLRNIPLPLPPLNEQMRIVEKIEELFSELDAGEESLRRARRQLGVYRQSLLKQAFEGKLTAKWREKHVPKDSRTWLKSTVAKIGRIETGTTPPTAEKKNYGSDLPFFKPTDLDQGRFVRTPREFLSQDGKRHARVLPLGSVLVTCIGATIGKTGLAQVECATNQQINSISTFRDVLPEFAYYQVISPSFQDQIHSNASSTTLPILNKSKFSALSFVCCSLHEQQEIVRLLDERFSVIEENEREIDAALKRSEALRQSILKKAFTGQLVPQYPSDEPASVLLERIRAERGGETIRTKRRAT